MTYHLFRIFLFSVGFVLISGTISVTNAQLRVAPAKSIGNTITCHVGNDQYKLTPDKQLIIGISAAPNNVETQNVFDKIAEFTDLRRNIYTVPVTDDINVQICPGDVNYIVYNGSWLEKIYDETKSPWALYAIIAHEIGHYVKAHDRTALGSNPKIELEADEYAGETLAKMGACLSDAQAAFRSKLMGENQESHTHPPISDRLIAVKKGWDKFGNCPADRPSGNSTNFTINTPFNGEKVGLTTIVRGKTPYSQLNHYIVAISFQAKRYYIQQPVKVFSNGEWEGFAAFGTTEYGKDHDWSIRIFATKSTLPVGELFDFPKDAIFSNEIVVKRTH